MMRSKGLLLILWAQRAWLNRPHERIHSLIDRVNMMHTGIVNKYVTKC